MPGLNRRYFSFICNNLKAARLLRPWTFAARANWSLPCLSVQRREEAKRFQTVVLVGVGSCDAHGEDRVRDVEGENIGPTGHQVQHVPVVHDRGEVKEEKV